jgi:hypothetical protein
VFGAAIAASGSSTAPPAKAKPNPKLAQQRERRKIRAMYRNVADHELVAMYETDIWHLRNELRTGKRSQFRPERLSD